MNLSRANKFEKIMAVGAILSFALSAVFIKLSGFSVSSLVNLSNTMIGKLLAQSSGLNTFGSISVVLGYFASVFLALAFLTLAFSFLASYGFYENRKKAGLVLSFIGGIIFFFFLGFTLASLLVAVGIVISGYVIVPMANNYGQEFKKWIHFRVGSNTVSRAHFIFNLAVAIAVFVAVLSGLAFYQAEFKSELKSSISAAIKPSLPSGIDEKSFDALMDKQVATLIASPLFSSYISWLPVISAFTVWAILEFLRLFTPFLAGAFTSLIIKLENKD